MTASDDIVRNIRDILTNKGLDPEVADLAAAGIAANMEKDANTLLRRILAKLQPEEGEANKRVIAAIVDSFVEFLTFAEAYKAANQ